MTNTFRRISLKIRKEIFSNLKPNTIVPCQDGGFLVQYNDSCWVSRYDSHYNLSWQKEIGILPDKYDRFNLTVSPDGDLIGIHGKNVVRVFDKNGVLLYNQDHEPWEYHQSSECYFSPIATDGKKYLWFFTRLKEDGGCLHILDASDFSLVDSFWQEDIDNHFSFYPTPDKDMAFIQLAAGQDGSQLFGAQLVNQKIVLTEYDQCYDRFIGSFSPAGKEFVLTPHYDEAIEIFSFPDIKKIAEISQESLFEGRDEFRAENFDGVDYTAHFLSSNTIIVKTRFGRLLLIDRKTLQCTGELLPAGCNITGYDEKGNPVSNPEMIFDYAGDIWDLKLTDSGQLFIIHSSNSIKIYDLPKDI